MIAHQQVTTTNELRPVFHFDISSIIGVLGKDGGMDITTQHTHTTWWWDLSNRANESESLGGCLLFPSCMVGVGVFTSGATLLRRRNLLWPGRLFRLDASMPVPLSPSNYNFLDQVARGPTPFLSCLPCPGLVLPSFGTSHTTNINGDRNSFSDGAWAFWSFACGRLVILW